MAWFPGANTSVRGNSPGSYTEGCWKILVHTTEGPSADGAFGAYRQHNTWPHFTADALTIYQHLDTSVAGSALKNVSGGVETNRSHALQIEMVAYAAKPKDPQMLARVGELCAWLSDLYGIPSEWPSGYPQGSGGPHNRSTANWNSRSGWYGHSQAPESDHWDPGKLSDEELAILMGGGMEKVRIFVNSYEQTAVLGAWLASGNSVMDISDWCRYAGYAPPIWNNDQRAVYLETAKVGAPSAPPSPVSMTELATGLATGGLEGWEKLTPEEQRTLIALIVKCLKPASPPGEPAP